MKTDPASLLPTWLQRTLLAGLMLILVLMPLHAFISTWGGTAIGPLWLWKSWKEILLGGLVLLALGWLLWRPLVLRELLADRLIQLVLAFVGLNLFMALIFFERNGMAATSAGLAMNLRYLAIAALAYVLLRYSALPWEKLKQWALRFLLATGVLLSVVGVLQVTVLPLDFLQAFGYDKDTTIAPYTLIDENPEAPRAFATLRGPNDFGAFLMIPLLVSLVFWRHSRWFILATLVILVGLFETSSRSAWLGSLLAVGALGWLTYGRSILRDRRWQLAIAGGLIGGVVVLVAAFSIPSVRLEVFHSSPGDPSLTEGSTDKHWQATAEGVERVVTAPLGCGPGCAGPASYYGSWAYISENYYVQLAEELGIIGLGLWAATAVVMLRRLFARKRDELAIILLASFAGLSAIGFWLHIWADDPLSLTWWLLAGAVLGVAGRRVAKQVS